jgi:hypothetical protein
MIGPGDVSETGNPSNSIIRSALVVGQEPAQLIVELEDEQAARMMTTGVCHVNAHKSFSGQVLALTCQHRPRYLSELTQSRGGQAR